MIPYKIQLDKIIYIDESDVKKVSKYNWWINKNGYVYSRERDKILQKDRWFYLHRYLLDVKDKKNHVDHIDDNKLNNCRSNLRICSNKQNVSRKIVTEGNTSNFKGVSWEKRIKKWRVTLTHNYKQVYVGTFRDEIEAARSYDKKAKELFGDFCRLNFEENIT